ncbi:Tyrosine-protein phosphatase Lar [Bagarius yarrelli]|uniref:Tyrosine-protein phosphatase Lar n=1 Tax=Bagarius yarrelli TaxID=175774 RepID=A0A556U5S5_BAGYA|nr:Tyrosine-protein phosphatase Lar [Bagarius yarrelli]
MTCSSPAISVMLNNSVKYTSPIVQKKIRLAEQLTLSWPRVNDNKGAIHEIRWKKINDSWQNIPPPKASFGGVSYNLSLNIPCYPTINKTISKNTFKIVATYSEVKVTIVAINNIGSSPIQEIIIPPVEHLKYCHNDSHRNSPQKGKHYCLEWYKLEDGETRPAKVNISWIRWNNDMLKDIKRGMKKSERYYYYLHTGRHQRRHTSIRCPVYSAEDVPASQPKNVTVFNITCDSAVLSWQSIPVQEQHGFLMDYVIRILKEGDTEIGYYEVTANESSFLLSNLEPGSSYTLSIAGRTKIGEGPNSTRTFFTLSLLKSKLLPIIPNPVISPAAIPHMDNQNMKPLSEVLDKVILLRHDDQDKLSHCPKQKLTLLHDCEVSVEEEEEDDKEDEEDESHFIGLISSDIPSSFPNPNYKGQLLQFTESLGITDKGQMENCGVNLPLYKNGLFFENGALDNEGMSVQL